ncbi:hypothetical protein [Tuberibacillus sp. Marseille-P3662]|uniref:hypothetical protein n=1 Tax=Tuberibacillus sp. Marseille-P3662 TaxID=1965358 RepID=UPI000A1C84B5|nr:hypothetical protein [Tuberibacillus sp. Marseille-P3662]
MKLGFLVFYILLFCLINFGGTVLEDIAGRSFLKYAIIGLISGALMYLVKKINYLNKKEVSIWIGVLILIGLPIISIFFDMLIS